MKGKVKCTCGWSWNKSDSSAKDMYICHECGRDNSNNMKNGGWMDNYNDSKASAPEGMVGDGFSNVGRNYSPAWGGQFEEGGEIPKAQGGKATRADSLAVLNSQLALNKFYEKELKAGRLKKDKFPFPESTDEIKKRIKLLNKENLDFYRKQIKNRADNPYGNNHGTYDDQYKKIFNLTPAQVKKLEYQGLGVSKSNNNNKAYYRDMITPMQNLQAPFALLDSRIAPQGQVDYRSSIKNYPGGDVTVYDYDPLAVTPFDMLTDAQKKERIKKYGTDGVPKSYIDKNKSQDKPDKKDKIDKQRPKVEALQPLTPQPVISNLFSDAKLPVIIPDARIPKYYDVDFQAHNIPGGRMTFHDRHEGIEQMSLEELTKWLRLQELMNQGYDERYRWDNLRERFPNHPQEWIDKQTEKLKAERAALDVKLTATPHYQTGGQFENGGLIPMAQKGERVPATRSDSLAIFNNAKNLEDYFTKQKYKKTNLKINPNLQNSINETKKWEKEARNAKVDTFGGIITLAEAKKAKQKQINEASGWVKEITNKLNKEKKEIKDKNDVSKYLSNLEKSRKEFDERLPGWSRYTDEQGIKRDESKILPEQYYKPLNENQFYQREASSGNIDLRSPMALYDTRITPQSFSVFDSPDLVTSDALEYQIANTSDYKKRDKLNKQLNDFRDNPNTNTDRVEMYQYDPLAVMPFDMVPPELQQQRVEKYGPGGVPQSVLDLHPEWITTPMTDPAQRQPVQSLRSLTPLQPVGTQIEASLPVIRPEAQIPKSYNVSALRYNMKGPSDYYNYNQEGVDYETAMKAKAASDAYNAEIEKKYGPESWYYTRKSPKLEAIAAERYKQLRSEFNMTPNYQMGGNVYPVNYVPNAQNGKNKKKKGVQDLLRDVENSVNKSLGNPMQKAHAAAYQLAGKWYNPKTKQWEENDPVDNFRHPMAGRYTSEAIQDKLYNIPILSQMVGLTGSNALGVAHELSTLFHPKDKRGWYDKIRESGEDIFNNAVGATVGSLPISDKRKTNILTKLSNQNMLPDGVSGTGGDMYIKHAMGGSIPGAVGFTYARTNDPAPSEGPYAKKTMASAQNGVDMYNNPILGRENLIPGKGRSNYNPRTNILNLYDEDPIYDQTRAHENYHARQFAEGRSNFDIGNNTENAFWALMQKRPEVSSTDEVFENYYNRKQKELELDRPEMVRILPETRFMPPKIIDKYTDRNGLQYRNAYSVEGEAQFYGETGEEFHKLPKGQNGKEMAYYKNGLDWKPKTISKNGGWLDQYDVAANGTTTQETTKPDKFAIIKSIIQNKENVKNPFDINNIYNKTLKNTKPNAITKKQTLNYAKKLNAEAKKQKIAEERAIVADREARMADAMKAQDEDIIGNPNWKEVLARETQSTGDKFRLFPNDPNSFIDDWLNPGVMVGDMVSGLGAAPYEMERQDSIMPLVTGIGAPLLAGALGGIGAKTNKQFINNIFNPVDIIPRSSSAEKYVGNKLKTAIPVSIKSNLKKGIEKIQKSNTYKALDEHLSGIEEGLFYDKRPFFEKFPITKAQKAKVYAAQDKAFEEGQQFIKDWHYGDDIDLHPDIVDKMKELDPDFKLSVFDNTNITNTSGPYANPFAKTKNVLLSTRRNALKNENISDYAKEYMLKERNKFRGVSLTTDENLTLRNAGLYHFSPQRVKFTGMHELGHTAEGLGTMTHWDPNGNLVSESIPFDRIRTYDPNFTDYNMANLNTDQGKLFQEAMIEPTPHIFDANGNITKRGYTWAASPGELHSELLPARSNLIDAYVAQGHDRKEIMNMIRAGVSDAQIDWMIDNKDLNRFFKPTTSPELKRKVIRMLYAGVPAAVGLDALMESEPNESSSGMKQGGIIKDDRGQWDHPGEITEIGSNQITMQGVPYDVLGISDTGDTKLMKPGKNYKFKGKKVTEFPMAKNGMRQEQKGLVNLDNLLNFTNYNKPQPGGWLNKYN